MAGAVCQGAAYAQAWVTRGLAQGAGERASAEKVRTEREAALADLSLLVAGDVPTAGLLTAP